jgi:threonine dehydrogenase-like Zn-dependent dehydrogenase
LQPRQTPSSRASIEAIGRVSHGYSVDYALDRVKQMGAVVNKALTIRSSQVFGPKYVPRLLDHAARGEFDPSFMITHKFSLEDAPKGYELWRMKEDGCVRSVFTP